MLSRMKLSLLVLLGLVLTLKLNARKHDVSQLKKTLSSDDQIVRNDRPIIGIVAQEVVGRNEIFGEGQFIGATYVKLVEAGGARAAPIFIDQSPEEIEKLFYSINGVIFPGGHSKLNESGYGTVGKQIFDLALKANQEGKVFPIWGECLGLEIVALLSAGYDLKNRGQFNKDMFTYTDGKNYSTSMEFHDLESSFLYSNMPKSLQTFMETEPFAFNNHVIAISRRAFNQHPKLKKMYRATSTSKDEIGTEFISTLEGRKYPFFLFHWHPSKTQFEWSMVLNINHSPQAVRISQMLFDRFMNKALQSDHRFASASEESAALIYNYQPTYTGRLGAFMQTYFFVNRVPYTTKFQEKDRIVVRILTEEDLKNAGKSPLPSDDEDYMK